jgi:2-oxoglutarate/2-oxoacid ferredoxin oxidoreductase subunit alpha
MQSSVTWKIGGEAGFGIMSAGTMLAKTFSRLGYHIFVTNEYPSLIRGGHNVITVRISSEKAESMNHDLHILTALNRQTVEIHRQELSSEAFIVYDPKDNDWKSEDFPNNVLIPIPLTEITKNFGGEPVMRNTVALGVTVALVGAEFTELEKVITDIFKRKGEEIIKTNVAVAKSGYDYVKKQFGNAKEMFLTPAINHEPALVINGSEMLGLAAVRSGLKFAAIYPMTPINAVITYLADHAKEFNIVYKQPEDEIAGITMAIGASYAGVRSMVATSGGGFALMVEGVSLAGMIEVPLVIDLGMRPGPATGMPTWSEQGELEFVIHAGHGDFPKIVLAPGDAEETFNITTKAFNLADKYQVPVFILTDKYLNENLWCVPKSVVTNKVTIDRGKLLTTIPDSGHPFERYSLDTPDGVSPRGIPGLKNGFFIANSYEHDGQGLVTDDPDKRTKMVDKRMKKLKSIIDEAIAPTVYGDENPDITFINWGTTKGAILEGMKILKSKGISSQLVHFTWLYPFPAEVVKKLLSNSKRIIDIEQNATGQLASLIREYTGIELTEKMLKYDGRPFYPEEIADYFK